MLTLSQLKQLLPKNPYVEHWHRALSQLLPDYDINTPNRIAAFVAQCAHESGGFMVLKENLNYKAATLRKIFPKYFPNDQIANDYASRPNKQVAIASKVYANRMGNGDEASQEGWKFCGRGLIQLTGKSNYQAFADSLEMDINDVPEYLATFEGAAQSACWFWETNKLNRFADTSDLRGMTKVINGGYKGMEDREAQYARALRLLGA
jgi:putative chitinase